MRLYLVSCTKRKRRNAAPARELYTSLWFVKARAYVESTGHPWFILSDEHGLVHPGQSLEPYDTYLQDKERERWSHSVMRQLTPKLEGIDVVVFLTFKRYSEFLAPWLRSKGLGVVLPLKGLKIGQQVALLDKKVRGI